MAYREYANSAGAIVDQGGNGDFLTLAAAMASATSGTTIFLKPGTYTENVTLKAGVNITAFTCDAYTPNVTISGTLTASFSGNVSISGIKLQTNGTNPFLNVTGASGVIFINCFFNCTTNTGMITSNASANITCYSCQSSSISNFTLFNLINIGSLNFYGCVLRNTGNSTTASTTAAGVVAFNNTYCEFVLTTSSGGTLDIRNSLITSVGAATTAITTAGTGNSLITLTKILSGSSSAVSIGTGTMVAMSNCVVDSTNTNAITGLGTLQLSEIAFTNSSSTINTTTITNKAVALANVTNHGVLIGGASNNVSSLAAAAAGTVLTGGGVTVNPAFSATPTVTSLTLGSGSALSTYIENTNWTPAIAFGGSSTGITYSTQSGSYTRIGNIVFITCSIVLTNKGAQTGNATLTGLPIAANETFSIDNYIMIGFPAVLTCTGIPVLHIGNGTSVGTFTASSNGTLTVLTNSAFANTTTIQFQGWYTAA